VWAGACAGELLGLRDGLECSDLDYLRSALDKKRGALERQPRNHVRTHTHNLQPLKHFTVVPHPLSPLRFNTVPVYTAAAAIPKSRGGRRATTPRATAVAHRQVWRPPRRTTCGGGREVTTREAAAAQQQQVWRPPRRSKTIRAAAAAQKQHVRRSPRRTCLHGGRSATTRRSEAAVQPHQG